MAGLDFLQAMSNTASDAVAGPVDIVSWLMKKAGIPVGDAVGGTAWQEAQGLRRPVAQSPEALAGETLGLLSPIGAAAKAPQIARGLLQAGDNLAAPRTLNPQKGAIVYHGSPHKFDRFDSSKIGTGEGAQAYGHGLYLAENPKVAEAYQNAGIGNIDWENATYGGRKIQALYDAAQRKQNVAHRLNDKTAISKANAELYYWESLLTGTHPNIARSNALDPDAGWPEMQAFVNAIDDTKFKNINFPDTGLYKVDLPDDAIARMLDWDKPLSQQASAGGLRGQIDQVLALPVKDAPALHSGPSLFPSEAAMVRDGSMTGGDFYRLLHANEIRSGKASPAALKERAMVEKMRAEGIPGIRYLDGDSRGAGAGTSNYVVFPGEEDILKILERNGQPLGLLGR
jgi:hypothetical protein